MATVTRVDYYYALATFNQLIDEMTDVADGFDESFDFNLDTIVGGHRRYHWPDKIVVSEEGERLLRLLLGPNSRALFRVWLIKNEIWKPKNE